MKLEKCDLCGWDADYHGTTMHACEALNSQSWVPLKIQEILNELKEIRQKLDKPKLYDLDGNEIVMVQGPGFGYIPWKKKDWDRHNEQNNT